MGESGTPARVEVDGDVRILRLLAGGERVLYVAESIGECAVEDGGLRLVRAFPAVANLGFPALSGDERWVAASCHDRVLRVWHLESGELAHELPGIWGARNLFFAGNEVIATQAMGEFEGPCDEHRVDAESGEVVAVNRTTSAVIAVCSGGERLLRFRNGTGLWLSGTDSEEPLVSIPYKYPQASRAFLSPDEALALVAFGSMVVPVSLPEAKVTRPLGKGHRTGPKDMAVTPDNALVLSCDGTNLRAFDLPTRKQRYARRHRQAVDAVVLLPDRRSYLVATRGGVIQRGEIESAAV